MEQSTIIMEAQAIYERICGKKVSIEDVEKILNISQIRIHPKGELIQGIQQPLVYTGMVLKGMLRSYYLDIEGNEITKYFSREGNFVVDEGLLGYEQSIAALESVEDSTILWMNTAKLKQLLHTNDTFKELYIACLESSLRYKIYRESGFLAKNATERYLQFCKDYPELVNRVKQSHISTYLGITPESLSRIRKTLKSDI